MNELFSFGRINVLATVTLLIGVKILLFDY